VRQLFDSRVSEIAFVASAQPSSSPFVDFEGTFAVIVFVEEAPGARMGIDTCPSAMSSLPRDRSREA